MNPSSVRLGSPAVTTRGFREAEMRKVVNLIAETLEAVAEKGIDGATETIHKVRLGVGELTDAFPLYDWKVEPVTA